MLLLFIMVNVNVWNCNLAERIVFIHLSIIIIIMSIIIIAAIGFKLLRGKNPSHVKLCCN